MGIPAVLAKPSYNSAGRQVVLLQLKQINSCYLKMPSPSDSDENHAG